MSGSGGARRRRTALLYDAAVVAAIATGPVRPASFGDDVARPLSRDQLIRHRFGA
jgi:hypothetical protein